MKSQREHLPSALSVMPASHNLRHGELVFGFEGNATRGQIGLGGFYQATDNSSYYIKADPAAVCLLESSARFAKEVIPQGFENCVNFAWTGGIYDGEKTKSISIQKKLNGEFKPWDEVISKDKRNPKSFLSFEFRNQDAILKSIDAMTPTAKKQLATAIYVSTLVGDESLHVGQFMVKVDPESQNITAITRLDFGARERFGVKRCQDQDFKHQTSYAYKRSGQFGKDYISYLLQHPEIKAEYMRLWARDENDPEQLAAMNAAAFDEELAYLPSDKQQAALRGTWEILNKGTGKSYDGSEYQVQRSLKMITQTRVSAMHRTALEYCFQQSSDEKEKEQLKTKLKAASITNSPSFFGALLQKLQDLFSTKKKPVIESVCHPDPYAIFSDRGIKRSGEKLQQSDAGERPYKSCDDLLAFEKRCPSSPLVALRGFFSPQGIRKNVSSGEEELYSSRSPVWER